MFFRQILFGVCVLVFRNVVASDLSSEDFENFLEKHYGADYGHTLLDDSTTDDPNLSVTRAAEVKALSWVMGKMTRDYGWGEDTAHTTLAVALTNASWALDPSNLEAQLVSKQFELELVLRLWRHKEFPMSSGHLALNILALVSLCKDPRAFHGKNLVSMLEHQSAVVHFEKAFGLLASCTAGKKVHKRNIRDLLTIVQSRQKLHSVDTMSVVLLALQCAQKHRNRDLSTYIEEAMPVLLKMQSEDGSFHNNIHSTALALQAMIANDMSRSWNATVAQQYLMGHQRPDGSFGNLFDTNAVMPILAGRTFLGVMEQPCLMQPQHRNTQELVWNNMEDTLDSAADVVSPDHFGQDYAEHKTTEKPHMITFTYIIWIGNDMDTTFNLSLTVPKNTNFFEVMQIAAEKDSRFQFSAKRFTTGYYVHKISDMEERQIGYWFWLLYKLREPPVLGVKPGNSLVNPAGVLETFPEEGDYMLFWYHQL